jgi:hypothetical protein
MKPGAALRAMRPVLTYICQICGKSFKASDARAKYCGNACQQRAKYARKKGQGSPTSLCT